MLDSQSLSQKLFKITYLLAWNPPQNSWNWARNRPSKHSNQFRREKNPKALPNDQN